MLLVTGGLGYIGSHVAVECSEQEIVILDNLSNSSLVRELFKGRIHYIQGDVGDRARLAQVFRDFSIKTVVHFAGRKSVFESVMNPELYLAENVGKLITLLDSMAKYAVDNIIFSGSASIYRHVAGKTLTEDDAIEPVSPYGWSKFFGEHLIESYCERGLIDSAVVLRYFNPIGAHPSGMLGDFGRKSDNLIPAILRAVADENETLKVFGDDHPTPDGFCYRDFVDVTDLAVAHLRAIDYQKSVPGYHAFNIGSGIGNSILQIVRIFEDLINKRINFEICERRPGEPSFLVASTEKANRILQWKNNIDISESCSMALAAETRRKRQ
jgi:UDP-glucose 4-epimerase